MAKSQMIAVEYHIRVKLPRSSGYASCPSGDTEYESDYKDTIFKAKPDGFEVHWPRLNEKWPVDSEGFTWVPLCVSDHKDALHTTMTELFKTQKALTALQNKVKSLV